MLQTEEQRKQRKVARLKNRARMTEQEKEAAEIFGTSALRMIGEADKEFRGGEDSDEEDQEDAARKRRVQKIRETCVLLKPLATIHSLSLR